VRIIGVSLAKRRLSRIGGYTKVTSEIPEQDTEDAVLAPEKLRSRQAFGKGTTSVVPLSALKFAAL
jgi:hypothetical protein